MTRLLTILRMVVRRSLGNGRLLAMVVVGMVFASGLMASVIVYSDAIRDLGLKHALKTAPPRSLDIAVSGSSQSLRSVDYNLREEQTQTQLSRLAGDITDETVRYVRTSTFFLTLPGQPVPEEDSRPRANLQFSDRLTQHVTLVEGSPPAAVSADLVAGQPPSFEVWVGAKTASENGVSVGDTFELHAFWRLEVKPVQIKVVGIVEQKNAADRYWFGEDKLYEETSGWDTFIFLTDERVLTELLSKYYPDLSSTIDTYAFVDIAAVNSRNAKQVEDRLAALKTELERGVSLTKVDTQLGTTIATYRDKLFFTRLPLFALMIQVVGIVLYYLVLVSTMVIDRQTGEIALLKSRGASVFQLMGIYFLESLLLSLVAIILGPLLIALAISLLGYTPPFQDLSGNSRLEIHLSAQAFGLSIIGAFLGMVAMLWPAYRASQLSVVHYKTHMARPQKQSVFLRYYLDLALIAVGAFAFYQLRQRGSLVTDTLFGGFSADPLLLATPTLFMLMMALLFLRIFPIVLRLVAYLARGMNGATIPLGLWHVVRSPLQYTRLILLLILATAVGMFAAGFGATLDRSYDDRAAYQGGADGRLTDIRNPGGVSNERLTSIIQEATGADTVTPAARLGAGFSLSQFQNLDGTMLGVVPEEFGDVAFWRDDFATVPLDTLMEYITVPGAREYPDAPLIPEGTRFVGAWVKPTLALNQFQLSLRVRDQAGMVADYRMGVPQGTQAGPDGYLFYVAQIVNPPVRSTVNASDPLVYPLRFESIAVRLSTGPAAPQRMSITIDDVQATSVAPTDFPATARSGFANGTLIEGFESLDRFEVITGATAAVDTGAISRTTTGVKSGENALVVAFDWQRGGVSTTGVRLRSYNEPLPVVVNTAFLGRAGVAEGDVITLYVAGQYMTVRIAGTFDYFPGFEPNTQRNLYIVDLEAVQVMATRVPALAGIPYANETWLSGLDETVSKVGLAEKGVAAETVFDRAALREVAASDPLIAASWSGILFLSFVSVLVLTAIGFIVSTHLAAQTRALEFAILRTMGFTGRQILALVSLEQIFVVAAGLTVGTLLGLPLVRLMIGYLGINETGAEVLPPMHSRVNWGAVALANGALLVVFIGTILSLAWTYTRLAVSRTLRMGDL